MIVKYLDVDRTSDNIRRLWKKSGISLEKITVMTGYTHTRTFQTWMSGKSIPSIDSILTLTSIFNCDLDDIIASREVEVML